MRAIEEIKVSISLLPFSWAIERIHSRVLNRKVGVNLGCGIPSSPPGLGRAGPRIGGSGFSALFWNEVWSRVIIPLIALAMVRSSCHLRLTNASGLLCQLVKIEGLNVPQRSAGYSYRWNAPEGTGRQRGWRTWRTEDKNRRCWRRTLLP